MGAFQSQSSMHSGQLENHQSKGGLLLAFDFNPLHFWDFEHSSNSGHEDTYIKARNRKFEQNLGECATWKSYLLVVDTMTDYRRHRR